VAEVLISTPGAVLSAFDALFFFTVEEFSLATFYATPAFIQRIGPFALEAGFLVGALLAVVAARSA
jgi:hypothetical protein